MASETILIATRGSALALAQANMVREQCLRSFPNLRFEIKIIKTTGDELQTASMAKEGQDLPKGLFTKELEVALLRNQADLAVHSLKDLPTELPKGLKLAGVGGKRADVRDVLIYRSVGQSVKESPEDSSTQLRLRGFPANVRIEDFPDVAVVATSSTRRKAQLLARHPGLQVPDIRGNVLTRIQKLATKFELDATVLALAGITRLGYRIGADGQLSGEGVPAGVMASILDTDVMLPCVGQGAIGLEVREGDARMQSICEKLNHLETFKCILAERAFLSGMGGGCQSPVAAYAETSQDRIRMRALSFTDGPVRRAEGSRPLEEAESLGAELAENLKVGL